MRWKGEGEKMYLHKQCPKETQFSFGVSLPLFAAGPSSSFNSSSSFLFQFLFLLPPPLPPLSSSFRHFFHLQLSSVGLVVFYRLMNIYGLVTRPQRRGRCSHFFKPPSLHETRDGACRERERKKNGG